MKSILKKTLLSLGLIALLFFSNTAADAGEIPVHNLSDCHIQVF